LEQNEIITQIEKKLEKQLNNVELNKKQYVDNVKLIKRIAFLIYEIDELETVILKNGVTEKYQNGANQWGIKDSAEVRVYNSLIKQYSTITNQLYQIIKDEKSGKNENPLNDFLNQYK